MILTAAARLLAVNPIVGSGLFCARSTPPQTWQSTGQMWLGTSAHGLEEQGDSRGSSGSEVTLSSVLCLLSSVTSLSISSRDRKASRAPVEIQASRVDL